jgi:geranylgeranyl pyrophosphate synthase
MKTVESSVFAPLANAFIELIANGGKRLRPAVALLTAELNGPIDGLITYRRLISLAAAVEMLHTSTLVHDDVIDGALLRRGAPTLNATWSQGATVLAGDYMFARAALFAAQTENMRVIRIFSDTLQVIVDGELRQLFDRNDYQQERENYYHRIYAKTASLFSAAAEAAAVLVGMPEDRVHQLRSYGYNLGMAFQIVDDILDFTGDETTLGKPAGSDLRQGTLTLPFFYLLQEHPSPHAVIATLEGMRQAQENGDDEAVQDAVKEIVSAIVESNAIRGAQQEAVDFLDQAVAAIQDFPASASKDSLLGLCAFVVQRNR